jgi:intracellular sulfur oxidation DsrE/DsrF family protein
MKMKLLNLTLGAVLVGLVSMPAFANGKGNTECPVGLVKDLTLDDEFGPGTSDITKCIKKRNQVKMVVQLNQYESSVRAYGLGNIANIIDDYEITHGMVRGRDYEIVAVIHSGGGRLALKNTGINGANVEVTGRNAYEGAIKALMSKGVKFYFCQNTTRAWMDQDPISFPITSLPKYDDGEAAATEQIIPGMLYTTAGLTSIADFQAQGYQYIQP